MKIIVGLGNPGTKYETTRHNAGFMAVDFFLESRGSINCQSKFDAQICEYHEDGNKILFVKPQSFMNLSGEVVSEIINFYKVDPVQDLLVIHDEVDLPFGSTRESRDSGAAGHNGVQNIIDILGTKNFARLRVGVENREPGSPIPTDVFVLGKFTSYEIDKLKQEVLPECKNIIEKFIQK